MSTTTAQIKLSRPDLYGKEYVSNALSFKVEGMNLISGEFRCISLDATDPNLASLSLAAVKIRDAINAGFNSDNFVARVEFMRAVNPCDGVEEQIVSVKLKKVAVIQGVQRQGIGIRNLEQVSFSVGELAVALSEGTEVFKGTDSIIKDGEIFDVPYTNFNPDLVLAKVDNDKLQSDADIYQEYDGDAVDEKLQKAYSSAYESIGEIVNNHGSFNYLVGQESSGGLFSGQKYTFYTMGASSCGGCLGTKFTLAKAEIMTNEKLSEEFGKKSPKVTLKAIEPEAKHFAVYKSEIVLQQLDKF